MPGPSSRSLLYTDGYKFSMAEAGFPLRREAFYYAHRKGGWAFLPVDVEDFVRDNLPISTPEDWAFLDAHGYFQGGAFRQAIAQHDRVKTVGLPRGSWFYDREPVFYVDGPSALPSWLEPCALQLNFRIQVATAALLNPDVLAEKVARVTCEAERAIVLETLDYVGVAAPSIQVDVEGYAAAVLARARRLVDILGDADRAFEVGMRAVSGMEQHRIALTAIRAAGIKRTSNVGLAAELDMIPVGTMGHEHIQRYGDDYQAFVAMRDKFPGFVFYLPDTFDTVASGAPSALSAMQAEPARNSGIRFDSEHGIRGHYLYAVNRARELGMVPYLGLESGWNEARTVEFEELRKLVDWPRERQGYGYGGYLVKPPWPHFGRDDVSAVWKLCFSLCGRMKFGDEPGSAKASIPGRPISWRPHLGMAGYTGPFGYVAQQGEEWEPPVPATMLSGSTDIPPPTRFTVTEIKSLMHRARPIAYSPQTLALIDRCTGEREAGITRALTRRS